MRKFVPIFIVALVLGMFVQVKAQTCQHEAQSGLSAEKHCGQKYDFFGQVVGQYNKSLKPAHALEAGFLYDQNAKHGAFAFFKVEDSTAAVFGGGTAKFFHWLKVGAGAGYDQEPDDVVLAGMVQLGCCDWQILAYGWAGGEDYYNYWVEGQVQADRNFTFGALWQRHRGAGTWFGYKIQGTPAELRIGGMLFGPFHSYEKEGADLTYYGTLRFNFSKQ